MIFLISICFLVFSEGAHDFFGGQTRMQQALNIHNKINGMQVHAPEGPIITNNTGLMRGCIGAHLEDEVIVLLGGAA